MFGCKSDKVTNVKDNSFDIALKRSPRMLNPYIRPMATERSVYQYIFTPIADYNPESYKLEPILIKEIPKGTPITEGKYKGGIKYTLTFRDEAVWEDGSPITGLDYAFSIKTIKHPQTQAANYRNYLSWVTDVIVDTKNNKKFDIIFKDYYMLAKELAVSMEVYPRYVYDPANVMAQITIEELNSDKVSEIISKNTALIDFAKDFNSIKYGQQIISGPGPYRFKNWITDQMIVLEKKKNYWGEKINSPFLKAGPDEIIFHIIPDQAGVMSQMKEGNIDLYTNMSADAFFDLKNNDTYKDKFQFFTPELMKYYYIGINNSKPELSDPKVRRALAKLVDVKSLIEVMDKGLGKQTVGIFNQKKEYYNDQLEPIELDIEGAKMILTKQGWADTNKDGTIDKLLNGEKIEMDLDMYITGSELSKNLALLLQQNGAEIGIKINIITKKYSLVRKENIKTRDYDLVPLVLSQDLSLDDPYSKWHSDNDSPDDANDMSYRSVSADQLIDNIRSTRDSKLRNKYYKELQKVMYDDQPVIFLYNPKEKIIVSNKWKGKPTIKRPGYLANTFVLK